MIHIQRFLDRIKFLQQQNSKEYTVSMHEARNLHMDITKLLLELKKYQDGTSSDEAISVEVKGEDF
jgi:ankyrin repeat protein